MSQDLKPSASHKIMIIMPDGRVVETSIVLTIDDLRDAHKTVIRMHGGSPQMIMSAKEALMVDISEVLKNLADDKVEVVGQYKTDVLVYYSPTAFSADQKRSIEMANQVYGKRLIQLEKQRRFHLEAIARLKSLYEQEKLKGTEFVALADQAKSTAMTPEEREQLVLQARREAMEMVDVAIKAVEAEKTDLARTVDAMAEQLKDTISIAQHSSEMERLKTEYDQVNKRAMMFWTKADYDRLTPGQLQDLARLLPKLRDERGNERLFDIAQVLKLKPNEPGLKEGTHVLVKYRPAAETKYFIGRLFFNDTKDYICLGQGFEITSGVYGGEDRSAPPADEQIMEFLAKNPLSVQIYLDAVRNSSIQTVQFWLHDLKVEQLLEIQSIDPIVYELMKDQMKIAYVRTYEIANELGQQEETPSEGDERQVDQALTSIRRVVVQPIASKYIPDEEEIKRKLVGSKDKLQREYFTRELKKLRAKKVADVTTIFETLGKLISDEDRVGRANMNLNRFPPLIIDMRNRLTGGLVDRIKQDQELLSKLIESLD